MTNGFWYSIQDTWMIHIYLQSLSLPTIQRSKCIQNHPGNLTSQTLTQASAPALTNLPSLPPSNHKTAFTPQGPAFLTAVLFIGFATLQTYTCVSREPDAQYWESDVQESELILALWLIQRDVRIF